MGEGGGAVEAGSLLSLGSWLLAHCRHWNLRPHGREYCLLAGLSLQSISPGLCLLCCAVSGSLWAQWG